jgi:hypothetical protein
MATTTASRYVKVGTPEPGIDSGWTIHVLDYKDMKSLVAVMTEFTEMSFTQELNAPGTGTVTLDEDSPFWTAILNNGSSNRALLNNEYVFEAWENGVPRFAWLGQTVENTIVGEDETRSVVISGPGIGQVLTWAKIWRPGWPTKVPVISYTDSVAVPVTKIANYRQTSYNDALSAFAWAFPVTWPTMRMWYTVFKAAQRRGLLKWVKLNFSATKDSAGKPWQLVQTIASASKQPFQPAELDESLLDFLNECTGQDYTKWFGQRLEWIMYPGFKLDVRPTIGQDRTKTVRFFQGNIISDQRTRDREEIFNRVTTQDRTGAESNRTDAASVKKWNIREQWNTTQKEVTDAKLRNQVADRLIAQTKDEKDQWSIQIPYNDPDRIPYRNFFVGDYVGLNADYLGNTPTAATAPVSMRVVAITVSVTSDSTIPDCELTLKSILDNKLDNLQKQITRLINEAKKVALGDLLNVDTTTATSGSSGSGSQPADGSSLTYSASNSTWQASATGGSGGGNAVYFDTSDPAIGHAVSAGDFWIYTGQF